MSYALSNVTYYITALSFKFCYLEFSDIMLLADGIKFNNSLVKLDMSNNGIKACVLRFFLEAMEDNCTLADWDISGNFLDDEFMADLAHLLEDNQTLHTIDISNNPIGPESAKYLLRSIL